jgi:hypothetical protein
MSKKKINPGDAFWHNYRHGLYKTPRAWAIVGEQLLRAADAVEGASSVGEFEGDPRFNLRGPALMLIGMSIEAKLKAIILNDKNKCDVVSEAREPNTADEKKLLNTFYGHDLVALAAIADVALSKEQTKIAKGLSTYILWEGRYVAPRKKRLEDIRPFKHDDGLVHLPRRDLTYEKAKELIVYVITEVKSRVYGET